MAPFVISHLLHFVTPIQPSDLRFAKVLIFISTIRSEEIISDHPTANVALYGWFKIAATRNKNHRLFTRHSIPVKVMAAIASPSLISTAALSKLSSGQTSLRVFHNPSQSNRSLSFYSPYSNRRIVRFSRQRTGVVFSATYGSSGTESYVESGNDADFLESVKVIDLNGNGIPISDLWKDRKAVVAFARHFGCIFCRKRADYLASKKDILDASGVALVLIGPGSIDQAKAFSEQTKFKGEVYADPTHSSYEALKFVSGVTTTFTPKAGLKIIELYMEGYRQDWNLSFQKDTVARGGWQQGGIIVAGPGKNNISYIHKDKEAGDDPDIQDILKACCS